MQQRGGVAVCVALCGLLASAAAQVPAPEATRRAMKGLTDVPGLKVGHHTLTERPTGCTVILVEGDGAVGGVSQRGGAPATKETNLLEAGHLVDKVNAVVLSGGSAFGLDAASGVMRWLEERKIGWDTRVARVPIVPAASLFDLPVGNAPHVRPTAECGYQAAEAATDGPVAEGNVGAGAGATVGKLGGGGPDPAARRRPMKGGLGSASLTLPNGLVVGAIVAVNSVGDVVDPFSGRVVAGVLEPDGTLADARRLIRSGALVTPPRPGENTTIGLVATNARLSKAQASRMALMADDGFARAISPSHTLGDGDTVFALATGRWDGEVNITLIGALAAEVMADAIVRAVQQATSVAGITAARDLATASK